MKMVDHIGVAVDPVLVDGAVDRLHLRRRNGNRRQLLRSGSA